MYQVFTFNFEFSCFLILTAQTTIHEVRKVFQFATWGVGDRNGEPSRPQQHHHCWHCQFRQRSSQELGLNKDIEYIQTDASINVSVMKWNSCLIRVVRDYGCLKVLESDWTIFKALIVLETAYTYPEGTLPYQQIYYVHTVCLDT